MKVIIELEDYPQGIFPTVRWGGNGVTDHLSDSLSMALAAQFAEMIKQRAALGTLKVIDPSKNMH
jgi:hypothetical protein